LGFPRSLCRCLPPSTAATGLETGLVAYLRTHAARVARPPRGMGRVGRRAARPTRGPRPTPRPRQTRHEFGDAPPRVTWGIRAEA
jgi:hypothetical protein